MVKKIDNLLEVLRQLTIPLTPKQLHEKFSDLGSIGTIRKNLRTLIDQGDAFKNPLGPGQGFAFMAIHPKTVADLPSAELIDALNSFPSNINLSKVNVVVDSWNPLTLRCLACESIWKPKTAAPSGEFEEDYWKCPQAANRFPPCYTSIKG